MGKKGKKAKITGTPDVVKFKQTREFWLLKECVTLQESLPFVNSDSMDDSSLKRVARFLNMVSLLAEHLQISSEKDYRFHFHHKFLAPSPQYFPSGFDINVIREAKDVQDKKPASFNGQLYPFDPEIQAKAEFFLKEVDNYMTKIASKIEPRLKDDFGPGLKLFKLELKEDIKAFDSEIWIKFERSYLEARHEIHRRVFEPVDRLVQTELLLTQAEEKLDIETKQKMEIEFMKAVNWFTYEMFPELAGDQMPEDVITLAEACIFYEEKCTAEWLHLAKYLIKDYLELRMYVMRISEERLNPNLKENLKLMRHLSNLHASILAAKEALDFVSRLPKLIYAKTIDWMTKSLLEPDLRFYQKTLNIMDS